MGQECCYLDLGLVFSQRSDRGEATGEINLPLAAVDTAKSPPAASSVKSHAPLHRGGQWKKGRKTVLTRTFETWKYPNKRFWCRDDRFSDIFLDFPGKFGKFQILVIFTRFFNRKSIDDLSIWGFLIFDEILRKQRFLVIQMLSRGAQLSQVTV